MLFIPQQLFSHLQAIERKNGRQRPYPNAPRTLDLDLILFGGRALRSEGLVIPHPRMCERLFVLVPLNEVWGEAVDPVSGLTVAALTQELRKNQPPNDVFAANQFRWLSEHD